MIVTRDLLFDGSFTLYDLFDKCILSRISEALQLAYELHSCYRAHIPASGFSHYDFALRNRYNCILEYECYGI